MNTAPFWPLSANNWTDEERTAAIEVINSGQVTMGSRVREFEEAFAEKVGAKYAVMTNSGSSANLLMVAALCARWGKGLNHGYEAIVPAIAWSTTYAPLMQHGFKLSVVDVNLATLNTTPEQVIAAVGRDTRLVMGVSILGNPAPLSTLNNICKSLGLWFLEDNCESFGATLHGQPCGTYGKMSTFSTFFSHHLNTVEGGVLVTDDERFYHLALCLRAHGWTRDLPEGSNLLPLQRKKDPLPTDYEFLMPAYNVRPTEIAAAVGLVQLRRSGEMNQIRKNNAQHFHEIFDNDPRFITQKSIPGAVATPFGFTLICQSHRARSHYSKKMQEAGIAHRLPTGGSFSQHPAAAYYNYEFPLEGTPNADRAHTCGFFVGNHPFDLTQQIDKLREVLS